MAYGQTLTVAGAPPVIAGDRSGVLVNNGTFVLPASYSLTNFSLANNNSAGLGSLVDLTVGTNCALTHTVNYSATSTTYRLNLSLRNLTVDQGGQVTADGCGYWVEQGPGSFTNFNYASNSVGATYAGIGENGNTNPPYGDPLAPTNLGSGGMPLDLGITARTYASGGGAIKLMVSDTLTVNGSISADGLNPGRYSAASGGSIWLDTRRLAGTGSIHANGAAKGSLVTTGGGGGGRIRIRYGIGGFPGLPGPGLYTNQQAISSTVTVKGGYNTSADGPEDGSISIDKVSQGSMFKIW